MPHGYATGSDTGTKLTMEKQHKNGERTKLIAEKIPSSDEWFAHVNDEGQMHELGRFGTKREAKKEMNRWANRNPKGLKGAGGGIPGVGGNGLF